MHVFTYGTLMFPEVWQLVVGRPFATARGQVAGYEIFRVQHAEFPGIIAAPDGGPVPGVVHLDVDAAALARLDLFEDDFYDRLEVSVDCGDGIRRQADTYVVPAARRTVLTDQPWRADQFVAEGGLDRFVARFAGFRRLAGGQP